jgi:hypothetical protein
VRKNKALAFFSPLVCVHYHYHYHKINYSINSININSINSIIIMSLPFLLLDCDRVAVAQVQKPLPWCTVVPSSVPSSPWADLTSSVTPQIFPFFTIKYKYKQSKKIHPIARAPHLTYIIIIIIVSVTVTKSYSVYIKYYSKQGEKIVVLVRILMSKSGKCSGSACELYKILLGFPGSPLSL